MSVTQMQAASDRLGCETLAVRIDEKSHYGEDGARTRVLAGLAFALTPGAFACLVGPSGCGKTTTLRILLGLDTHFDGAIGPAFREGRLAVAFQEPRLLPWRTVGENVALALGQVAEREARVEAALGDVGLAGYSKRFPGQLSLGQARRAALARAFAVRPDILFLDEPFVSLDEASAQRLRALLTTLARRERVTVLMVTHNVREAVTLADRILLLTERPARLAADITVPLGSGERTLDAVGAVAAELAARHPELITL